MTMERLWVTYLSGRRVSVSPSWRVLTARTVVVTGAPGTAACTGSSATPTTYRFLPIVSHPRARRCRVGASGAPRMIATWAPHQPRSACGIQSSNRSLASRSSTTTAAWGPSASHASCTTARYPRCSDMSRTGRSAYAGYATPTTAIVTAATRATRVQGPRLRTNMHAANPNASSTSAGNADTRNRRVTHTWSGIALAFQRYSNEAGASRAAVASVRS